MKVVLGSTSAVKLQALTAALQHFGLTAEVLTVKARSGIAEQPFDEETIRGAENRARDADKLSPGADLVIAIESGLFREKEGYFDIAVVLALLPNGETICVRSDAVEFPEDAVRETIARGVDVWTCGKVLAEWGRVSLHDDPHASLSGKPRAKFLEEAVIKLFANLKQSGEI